MTWAKAQARRLEGPGIRLVLLLLADRASDDAHTCWPSVSLLADEAGVTERQVRRYIGQLRDAGLIEIDQLQGDRRSNLYRLLIGQKAMAAMKADMVSGIADAASMKSDTCEDVVSQMSAISSGDEYRTSAAEIADIDDKNSGHHARALSEPKGTQREPSLSTRGVGEREPVPNSDDEHAEQTFAELAQRYGVNGAMQINRARAAWRKLSRSERKAALGAVAEYLDSRKAAGRTMQPDIANWIVSKAWQDVVEARKLRKAIEVSGPSTGFLAGEGSEQWQAWLTYHRCRGATGIPEYAIERHAAGRMLRTREEWPPVGRGLDPERASWVLVAEGTPQFAAWIARLREGPGGAIGLQTADVDGRNVRGLRVPQEWPPSKKQTHGDAAAGTEGA